MANIKKPTYRADLDKLRRLPDHIKRHPYFCLWKWEYRDNRWTKVPYNPCTGGKAQSNNSSTFSTLDATLDAYQRGGYDGVGIGLFDGMSGVDIDHHLNDGKLDEFAQTIVDGMSAYTEVSPSGDGVHVLFSCPAFSDEFDRKRYKALYMFNKRDIGLETYVCGITNRFLTISGRTLSTGEGGDKSDQLRHVLDTHMKRKAAKSRQKNKNTSSATSTAPSDEELLTKAMNAANGDKFTQLWNGDTTGYGSQSEADQALCNMISFWWGKDESAIDRMFRQSKLYRDKWEREDYRKRTIEKALEYWESTRRAMGRPGARANVYQTCIEWLRDIDDEKLYIHDRALSVLFARVFMEGIAYVPEWKSFACFNGSVWITSGAESYVDKLVKTFVQAVSARVAEVENDDLRKFLQACASTYNSQPKRVNLRNDIKCELIVSASKFDANPHLLNVQNGTLDFDKMVFRAHEPADRLTHMAPTTYEAGATCDLFTNTLKGAVEGDADLYEYVQKLFGIIVAGDTSRDFFALVGTEPRAGKDTIFGALRDTLGVDESTGYALSIDKTTFRVRQHTNGSAPSSDRARMRGRRLLLSSEFNEAERLDAAMLKELTGGGYITARYMRQNDFSFQLSGIIVLLANKFPILNDEDVFKSRRARAIPFDRHLSEESIDDTLRERLKSDAARSGILSFAVEGWKKVKAEGFTTPDAVKEKTEDFRRSADELGAFLANVIERREGAFVTLSELYQTYLSETQSSRDKMGQREFYRRARAALPVCPQRKVNGDVFKNVISDYALTSI